MIIDITQTIKIGKVYRQGSEPLKVERVVRSLENGSEYNTIAISCDVHNLGTHIDAVETDVIIEKERLIGPGVKLDISDIIGRPVILKDIETSLIKEGVYIFFQSNKGENSEKKDTSQTSPEISMEVLEYLVSKKVNMVGIDASGLATGKNHTLSDRYLGKHKNYVIENLTNLDLIPLKNFKVYCLPLNIEGLDALPVRILVEF